MFNCGMWFDGYGAQIGSMASPRTVWTPEGGAVWSR